MATYDGYLIAASGVVASSDFLYRPGATFDSFGFLIGGVPTFLYRMRGFDQTLAEVVYWTAGYIDDGAAEYTGPGPVVSIIVSHVLGT